MASAWPSRAAIPAVRADEERRGVVAQVVPDVADDVITELVQCGSQVLAVEQGAAAVKRVELSWICPALR